MKQFTRSITLFCLLGIMLPAGLKAQKSDSLMVRRIFDYYLLKAKSYDNLRYLTTRIGGRLSGSPQAAKAVDWAKKAMYDAGADTVYLQPCKVPHWVRGAAEQCQMFSKGIKTPLNICALGGSVATPKTGLTAEVIEVKSFEELDSLGEKNIKGRIVFYNVFFDQAKLSTGAMYGESVKYRWAGASRAAKYGAVATMVRSMSSVDNDFPHTGAMGYDTTVSKRKIPSCALSYAAASKLAAALVKDQHTQVSLKMSCTMLPDELSYNVVGEIEGSENADEIILAGGHLDSWDNGQGAHDDGSGVVQAIEVLAMFKQLGIKPKHTIRAVAFMNEENGGAGGKAYFEDTKEKGLKHILAIESDAGGFCPRGIGVDTLHGAYKRLLSWKPVLNEYYLQYIDAGGGGADISRLRDLGVPLLGIEPDGQKYFDYHHTADDTFDKVNKRELHLSAGIIGSIVYLVDFYGI
ncbi:MAG: M20/M25/M40 family metallo-hydrolase [Bacteroidetes bacterium]|nr:M20/M25/M40 family metallo-hydrolase [Bacteroidota bacterium]